MADRRSPWTIAIAVTALSTVLMIVLSGCGYFHTSTAEEGNAALQDSLPERTKAYAEAQLPQTTIPPCAAERKNADEIMARLPGSKESSDANLAFFRCTTLEDNKARCQGKAQPCGLVIFNPPAAKPGDPQPQATTVDVSDPQQVSDACGVIGAAAGVAVSGNPATGLTLGSVLGNFYCGAYMDAAAKDDPMLFVAPALVPTVQLARDLKQLTGIDATPEGSWNSAKQAIDRSFLVVNVQGVPVPVSILPPIPVGGTPGQALTQASNGIKDGLTHVADEANKKNEETKHIFDPNPIKNPITNPLGLFH